MWPLNAAAASVGIVTVSGGTLNDDQPAPTNAKVSVEFNLDGNVYRLNSEADTPTQIDTATDWIKPLLVDPAGYEIFVSNAGPDGLAPGSDVLDTWLDLGTTRTWGVIHLPSSGSSTAVLTIQIRRDALVLDSGVYTLNAIVL